MQILKAAVISFVTTSVLLPLGLIMAAAIRSANAGGWTTVVHARLFLLCFAGMFVALFVASWLALTLRDKSRQRL
jgi:hypothetical protein